MEKAFSSVDDATPLNPWKSFALALRWRSWRLLIFMVLSILTLLPLGYTTSDSQWPRGFLPLIWWLVFSASCFLKFDTSGSGGFIQLEIDHDFNFVTRLDERLGLTRQIILVPWWTSFYLWIMHFIFTMTIMIAVGANGPVCFGDNDACPFGGRRTTHLIGVLMGIYGVGGIIAGLLGGWEVSAEASALMEKQEKRLLERHNMMHLYDIHEHPAPRRFMQWEPTRSDENTWSAIKIVRFAAWSMISIAISFQVLPQRNWFTDENDGTVVVFVLLAIGSIPAVFLVMDLGSNLSGLYYTRSRRMRFIGTLLLEGLAQSDSRTTEAGVSGATSTTSANFEELKQMSTSTPVLSPPPPPRGNVEQGTPPIPQFQLQPRAPPLPLRPATPMATPMLTAAGPAATITMDPPQIPPGHDSGSDTNDAAADTEDDASSLASPAKLRGILALRRFYVNTLGSLTDGFCSYALTAGVIVWIILPIPVIAAVISSGFKRPQFQQLPNTLTDLGLVNLELYWLLLSVLISMMVNAASSCSQRQTEHLKILHAIRLKSVMWPESFRNAVVEERLMVIDAIVTVLHADDRYPMFFGFVVVGPGFAKSVYSILGAQVLGLLVTAMSSLY